MDNPEELRRLKHRLDGAEDQLRGLLHVIAPQPAAGVTQVHGIEAALRLALESVCRHTGWPVGHVYVPAPESTGELVSAGIWHLEDAPRLEQFRKVTEQTPLAEGAGVPGRAHSSGKPAWVVDVGVEHGLARAAEAKKAGLKSTVAFPVPSGERTEAIVEFFSREAIEADEQLLEAMVRIGSELGRAFERARELSLAQQAAELYRSVVETSPDAILVTDLNGVVLMSNRQAAIHYGFEGPEQLRGLTAFDFVAPEDRDRAVENARRTLETGAVRQVEYNLVRKDGTRIPAEVSASVIRDTQGQPWAFIGVVRDISERKRSEDALRSSEEKFRTLTHMNSAAAFVYKDGALVYANAAAAAITGYSVDEMLAMDIWQLVPADSREALRENLQRTLSSRAPAQREHLETKIITKSGEKRWVDFSGHPVEWEGGTAALGTAFDITERKRATEALRESEERYRTLYQDNPSMYFTVSAEGTVLSVNQFGAEQLRYDQDELVGKSVLDVFHEDDKAAVAEQLAGCVARPGEMLNWEFRKVRKDGEIIHVKEAARATLDTNGEAIVLIVCEDITERKRVEEELQKAREELEGKVEREMYRGRAYGLTFRELTVLHLIAEGNSDREIAEKLSISPLTVSKHVANILSKMGAASRSEASARAVRESLLA